MEPYKAQNALLNAIEKILTPLVHVFLKFGGSYVQFEQVSKQVFVNVAKEHFEFPRGKVTDSRISVITGINRHTVRLMMIAPNNHNDLTQEYGKDAVVSGWINDPEFQNDKGQPRVLTRHSVQGFNNLVQQYCGDQSASTVADKLVELGVCRHYGNTLELIAPDLLGNNDAYASLVKGWKSNSNFTDHWGRPKVLLPKGELGFIDLCKKYGGDNPEKAILDVLIRIGCCAILETEKEADEKIKLISGGVIPKNSSPDQIIYGCDNVAAHMETVAHNILNPSNNHFQELAVFGCDVPQEYLADSHLFGALETEHLVRKIDERYMAVDRQINSTVTGIGSYKAGFGFFYFQQTQLKE